MNLRNVMTDSKQSGPSSELDEQTRQDRRTFFPVQVVGSLFVMTILIYVAAMMGDASQPIDLQPEGTLRQSILNHGLTVIVAESLLLTIISFRAMAQDRRNTLARIQTQSAARQNPL